EDERGCARRALRRMQVREEEGGEGEGDGELHRPRHPAPSQEGNEQEQRERARQYQQDPEDHFFGEEAGERVRTDHAERSTLTLRRCAESTGTCAACRERAA